MIPVVYWYGVNCCVTECHTVSSASRQVPPSTATYGQVPPILACCTIPMHTVKCRTSAVQGAATLGRGRRLHKGEEGSGELLGIGPSQMGRVCPKAQSISLLSR